MGPRQAPGRRVFPPSTNLWKSPVSPLRGLPEKATPSVAFSLPGRWRCEVELMAGLSARDVSEVILTKEGQVLWWENIGVLSPLHSRKDLFNRWLFHDLVEAMSLRSVLVPLGDVEVIPKAFRPVTEEVRDQMLLVKQALFTHPGDIRELNLYLGIEGELVVTTGSPSPPDPGFQLVSVSRVESLAHTQLVGGFHRHTTLWWKKYMVYSEEVRKRGLKVQKTPLHAQS